MTTKVKICGLKTEAALEAALAGGADYVGFVFFAPEPAQRGAGRRPGRWPPGRAAGPRSSR